MTKKNYELTLKLRDDLMAAYKEVSRKCWSQQEAWKKTAKHPAPRYYVTAKEAYEKLRSMVKGDTSTVDRLGNSKRRLYYSLFDKLEEMTQRRDLIGKSLWFICPLLVAEPAPEFFVEPNTVKDIYTKYRLYGRDFKHRDVYKKRHKNKSCADATVHTDASL